MQSFNIDFITYNRSLYAIMQFLEFLFGHIISINGLLIPINKGKNTIYAFLGSVFQGIFMPISVKTMNRVI